MKHLVRIVSHRASSEGVECFQNTIAEGLDRGYEIKFFQVNSTQNSDANDLFALLVKEEADESQNTAGT
jgi:hypothetical protein